MKKFIVFAFVAMMFVSSCTAQNSSSVAQQIVGTWTRQDGVVFVFNADGTATKDGNSFFWGMSAGGLIGETGGFFSNGPAYISPNGKRMIINDNVYQKK